VNESHYENLNEVIVNDLCVASTPIPKSTSEHVPNIAEI
jgi:hypothetical protein